MLRASESLGGNPEGARKLSEVGTLPKGGGHHRPTFLHEERFECELPRSDPKGGELCLARAKPRETLVEARRGSVRASAKREPSVRAGAGELTRLQNVQIDRQS